MAQNNMRKMYTETDIQRLAEERVNQLITDKKLTKLYLHRFSIDNIGDNTLYVISNTKTPFTSGVLSITDVDIIKIVVSDDNLGNTLLVNNFDLFDGSYTDISGNSHTIVDYEFLGDVVEDY